MTTASPHVYLSILLVYIAFYNCVFHIFHLLTIILLGVLLVIIVNDAKLFLIFVMMFDLIRVKLKCKTFNF